MSKHKQKQQYAFPTVVPCPRCRGTQTRAVSTQGKIQYRRCSAPICQERFSIRGKEVTSEDQKIRREEDQKIRREEDKKLRSEETK